MKRITVAVDLRALTSGKISGVEMYIHNILRSLLALDKKNTYILYINSKRDFTNVLKKYADNNVRILQTRIPSKLMNLLLIFLRLPKLDKLIYKKTGLWPDVFFVPDLRPTPLTRKTKKITVIHDLAFMHFPQFYSRRSRLWFKIISPRREIKESATLIAVSKHTAKDITDIYKTPESKIRTVYEAANENLLKLREPAATPHIPSLYFLSLGTLEPRKNLPNLIAAYKKFRDANGDKVKLVIAGRFNEKAFAKLELKKDKDIYFTGFVDKYQKAYLLKHASALIYPSLFEGFGLPVLEAMIFSTPVITSNTSSLPEVAGDAALLINPRNIDEMAEAMEEALNPGTAQKLKQKMAARIKLFSWKKCAEETLRAIEDTVG